MKKFTAVISSVIFLALFSLAAVAGDCRGFAWTNFNHQPVNHCPMDQLGGLAVGAEEFYENIALVSLPSLVSGFLVILFIWHWLNIDQFYQRFFYRSRNLVGCQIWQPLRLALAGGVVQGKTGE